LLCSAGPLSAQQKYTLDDCYRLALKNNTAVKRAQNDINTNYVDRKTAQFDLLPSVSYSVNHYFSFGKNIDPVTNSFAFDQFSGGATALSVQLELFTGFRKLNAIKQSGYNIKAAEYAKKKAELELLSGITLIYARLLFDKEQAAVARNNIKTTTKELEIVGEKIKSGRLTKYDYYAFNARLNSEQAELITIQNDSLTASQELKQYLNFSYKENVVIVPIDTIVLTDISSTNISTPEFIEAALQTHPAIKQARMNEQVARLGVKMAKSSLVPTLVAGGNLVSNYNINEQYITEAGSDGGKIPFKTQLKDNFGQNIDLGIDIPIFSKRETINTVKKEKVNLSNAQLAINEAENAVVSNTLLLINEFNAGKQKYQSTLEAWKQNSLSYNLYREKYLIGQISSVELLTARDILNGSSSKYLQAKLELFFRYQLLMLLQGYH
jgi:outer membrane protein